MLTRRRFLPKERPYNWTLNPASGFAQGLLFFGGGQAAGGSRMYDGSRHRNDGTLTNMDPATDWVWSAELDRWVLDFDGSNDYVAAPSILTANENVMTVSVWVHPDAEEYTGIIAKDDNPNREWFLAKLGYSNLRLRLYQTNGTSRQIDTPLYDGTLTAGQRTHVCVVINGVIGTVGLYINGVWRDFTPASWDGTLKNTIASPLWLAKTYVNGYEFNGQLADPLIYNRALTPSEIQQLADPSNVMLSGLILPPRRLVFPSSVAPLTIPDYHNIFGHNTTRRYNTTPILGILASRRT